MTFEEEFPSMKNKGFHNVDIVLGATRHIKRTSCYSEEEIRENTVDKQRVKETVIKYTQGTKYVRHEDCDRPYGDECGYCEFCRQRQSELQTRIFKELGLE